MNKQEYLDKVLKYPENPERTKAISELYGTSINGIIARVVSFAGNADFIGDERRAFSYDEILNASKEYGKDFKALGIIPFVDAYDNDLIVYVIAENVWAKYNMGDDIIFKKRDALEKLL